MLEVLLLSIRFHDILLRFFFRLHLDVDGVTHRSGGGGCVELKDGREDIDILAEIISDGEEITVSAGSFKLQSKVLLAADPLPLAKIESGVSVTSLFLSWLISDFWCFNGGVTKISSCSRGFSLCWS